MEINKADKKEIVKMAKEVLQQSDLEIKRFNQALKRAMCNKITSEALIEKFK